jgi:hypothetical protein
MESGESVVSATFVTPYPPGFPVLVPGQVSAKRFCPSCGAWTRLRSTAISQPLATGSTPPKHWRCSPRELATEPCPALLRRQTLGCRFRHRTSATVATTISWSEIPIVWAIASEVGKPSR